MTNGIGSQGRYEDELIVARRRIAELEAKLRDCTDGARPAPEKPSAPQEVTTENFDRLEGCGLQMFGGVYGSPLKPITTDVEFVRRVQAREATEADIRENVARETAVLREELFAAMSALEKQCQGRAEAISKWSSAKADADGLRADLERSNSRVGDYQRRIHADDERIAYLDGEVLRLTGELDAAKAANREQRRLGAEDAAAWIKARLRTVGEEVETAIGCGEVLRDGKKQERATENVKYDVCVGCGRKEPGVGLTEALCPECVKAPASMRVRAPEKTGRLPDFFEVVFARKTVCSTWSLRSIRERRGSEAFTVGDALWPEMTLENEGVLWCRPRPGMVG